MGPLGHGPAARRALGAGRIPVLERALDLRGCTSGPQLPPLLPPSGAAPLPALTSPLSISPRPPPPGEGARGLRAPRPRDPELQAGCRLPQRAARCPLRGPRAPPAGPGWVGSPAWFRLEGAGREGERPGRAARLPPEARQPGRPVGRPGAAARPASRDAAPRVSGAGARFQTADLRGAAGHRARLPARAAVRARSWGRARRAPTPCRPARRLPTMPATHSHTSARRPALAPGVRPRALSRRPGPDLVWDRPRCSPARALPGPPGSGRCSRPRGSRVGAGPAPRRGGGPVARACSGGGGGGEEVRRRPESEPRPRLRGASAWQSLLGKLRPRARTLPAAPRDPGGLKRKPNACSSLRSPDGFAPSQPASGSRK